MKYDNTVTLGNVLTAITMLFAGAAVYASMTERIAKVETAQKAAVETDRRHESDLREVKAEIKSTLIEIKDDIRELRNDLKVKK